MSRRCVALLVIGLATVPVFVLEGAASSTQLRWAITDLGAVGGSSSQAAAVNERGQVVGTFWTRIAGETRAHAFLWQGGRSRDLGTLPLANVSTATALNDNGQVIGESWFEIGGYTTRAFLWQNGRMVALGGRFSATTGWGDIASWARAINELGDIVGQNANSRGYGRATLWRGGRARDLGSLPGRPNSIASALNERGQVVGASYVVASDDLYHARQRAFLWEKGRLRDLGTLAGERQSWAVAINNRGQIIGMTGDIYSSSVGRAWVLSGGRMRSLGIAGNSAPTAINDRGQVIATRYYAGPARRSYLWQEGKLTDLGVLPRRSRTEATAINEHGRIVGSSCTSSGEAGCRAFLWESGRMIDLGTLPGGTSSGATAINDRNQIVGWSGTANGTTHAVLWTPKRSR